MQKLINELVGKTVIAGYVNSEDSIVIKFTDGTETNFFYDHFKDDRLMMVNKPNSSDAEDTVSGV